MDILGPSVPWAKLSQEGQVSCPVVGKAEFGVQPYSRNSSPFGVLASWEGSVPKPQPVCLDQAVKNKLKIVESEQKSYD